jgi:hypothetical protein
MCDGRFLLIYKAVGSKNALPFGGPVVHLAAVSDHPTGPFEKHYDPLFTCVGESFPAEDPYIWYDANAYWAIVKDLKGAFTGEGRSLALFTSGDGLDWRLAPSPLVSTLTLNWADGEQQLLHRLERPQLWMDNDGSGVLFCAASEEASESHAMNIHIPLAP